MTSGLSVDQSHCCIDESLGGILGVLMVGLLVIIQSSHSYISHCYATLYSRHKSIPASSSLYWSLWCCVRCLGEIKDYWLIDWLIDWLVEWLIDWMIDCLIIDWLSDWLILLLHGVHSVTIILLLRHDCLSAWLPIILLLRHDCLSAWLPVCYTTWIQETSNIWTLLDTCLWDIYNLWFNIISTWLSLACSTTE